MQQTAVYTNKAKCPGDIWLRGEHEVPEQPVPIVKRIGIR
jgi:hypothetical protein